MTARIPDQPRGDEREAERSPILLWLLGAAVVIRILFEIGAAIAQPDPTPEVSVGPPAIICEGTPTDFTCEEQK